MNTEQQTHELQEAMRKKYHFYVQISTQFQMMGKGPHRYGLYEKLMHATREWRVAQQQFQMHVRQLENDRIKSFS